MWAHYGDKHKGICLGFDVDDSHLKDVTYYPERIASEIAMDEEFGGLTEDIIEKLLCAKYIGWSYENEVRVIVPKAKKDPRGIYFMDFEGNMELKEVILGPRCTLKTDQIAKYLTSYICQVEVFQSRIAFTKYEVVRNKAVKPYVHLA